MRRIKLFSILALAISMLSLQSCSFEQEDVFDKSAAERLSDVNARAKEILVGSEYGWVLDMFPDSDRHYGGFAYTLKFTELEVEARTERMPGVYTSYYRMTDDNGPALLFDTYNKAIHEFSTPSGSSSAYEAMHGEFEFIIVKADPELIVLRGPRTGNTYYMRPLTEPAESYLSKVANRTVQMGEVASIGGNLGNSDFVATIDNENRQFTFTADGESKGYAYVYTDTGLRFYEPVKVGTTEFMSMAIADGGASLTVEDGEAAGTVFPSVFIVRPAGYRPFQAYEGKYKFKFSKGEFEVTLVPSDDYTSYIMQGINDNYEFMLSYDKISGTLSLCGQILKHNGSYVKDGEEYIALIPWAASDGYSTSTTTAGMVTKWNGDEAKPVYTFTDNGKWKSYKVTGFLLKRAKGTAMSSSNNIANITNTAFFPFTGTGKHQLSSVSTLTKID